MPPDRDQGFTQLTRGQLFMSGLLLHLTTVYNAIDQSQVKHSTTDDSNMEIGSWGCQHRPQMLDEPSAY